MTLTSMVSMSPQPGYPSVLLRCTQCSEAEEGAEGEVVEETGEVCGSDWKTYSSQCQLEWEACKRNWNIVQVSEGPCVSQCPDVDLGRLRSKYFSLENVHTSLGMFSATGTFRATNKGSCIQEYFRCRKLSNQQGLEGQVAKDCCLER